MVIPIRDLQEQETNLQKESDKTPPKSSRIGAKILTSKTKFQIGNREQRQPRAKTKQET